MLKDLCFPVKSYIALLTLTTRQAVILWAIAVLASLCCAVVLMKFAWDYYASHPTLTVIQSTHHGIWNYPFPAVTICDNNRVSLNLTRQFVEKLKLPASISQEFMVAEMALLTELLYPGAHEQNITKNLTRLQDIFDYNGLSVLQVMKAVTRDCKSLIEACMWNGQDINCSEIFESSLSQVGFCCSFNYIGFRNRQYLKNAKPRRVTGCGYQTGITILMNLDPGDYHAIMYGTAGAKIMFHDPYDYPDYNAPSKLMSMDIQTFITIEPQETYSMRGVRNLAIATRSCVFLDEGDQIIKENGRRRNLTAARYSYINCMAECRATIISHKCGCIPYYFPQNNTRICNLKDVSCLARYKSFYDTSWPGVDMSSEMVPRQIPITSKRPCGCMPDCNLYRYFIESSRGHFDQNVYHHGLQYTRDSSRGSNLQNHSVLHVFFADLVSIQYRRNVHYNWRNLFASFGGLLGLFAGFSLMSVFELIYFFIIRALINTYGAHGRTKIISR